MTRRRVLLIVPALLGVWCIAYAPASYGDYYNYPCNYPFVGTSADVDVLIHAGGQFCDGPMEINGSHYHCESGGGGIGGGAIGIAPISGGLLDLGGFGGSGFGGTAGRCEWRCPDNTRALAPNPPAAWVRKLTVTDATNDCRDHMRPAGADSAPAPGNIPDPAAPPAPAAPPPPPGEGSLLTPGNPMPLP